jgi:hypothetical protein
MWKTVRVKDRFCHYCKLEAALKTDPILPAAGATPDKDPKASITQPPAAKTVGPDLSDPKGVNPDAGPSATDLPSGGTTKDRPSLITKFLGDVSAGMRSGTVYNLQQFSLGLEMPNFSSSTTAVLEGYMLNQAQSNSRGEEHDPTPVIEALQLAYDMHNADPSEAVAGATAHRVWKSSDVSVALSSLSEGGDNLKPNVPVADLSELLGACGHPAMKDIVLTCIEQHVPLTDTHVELMTAALNASLKSLLEGGPISGLVPVGGPTNTVRGTPNDEATGVVSDRVLYSTHGSRWDQTFAIELVAACAKLTITLMGFLRPPVPGPMYFAHISSQNPNHASSWWVKGPTLLRDFIWKPLQGTVRLGLVRIFNERSIATPTTVAVMFWRRGTRPTRLMAQKFIRRGFISVSICLRLATAYHANGSIVFMRGTSALSTCVPTGSAQL